ncbi:MAG: N-acetylmuramoyl-L-alanine amidase [Mangrovicoccus sp.]|nr:N-acetylmuramoyl-L-alanine amidase [Mangrovicoccus sp.]
MAGAAAALERLCDPAAEVSAHYLIAADGRLWQLVDEADRAWHAGAGSWGGRGDVNSRSIGIELDNTGAVPFAEPLMARLESLLPGILGRWGIPPAGVIAHADMAPERKIDPGPRFDWRRLARQGLAVWPEGVEDRGDIRADGAAPAYPDRFREATRAFGYPEADTALVLRAFRDRFRPWAAGPLESADLVLAEDLARRYPVDPGAGSA